MRWHRITHLEVKSTLDHPDFLEPVNDGTNAWKKISDKYLRVSYKQDKETIVVITAVKKNKGWR
ncbi:MAG: hypothetical protein C0407_11180 [Desulfobacca sp.]|nr:hypothetical protein [Desulfobacca sp.]